MAYFLLKTEPSDYNLDLLEKSKTAFWDGVANNLAIKHLKTIQKGDLCFIYHTGNEKAIVGLAKAISLPKEDEAKGWGVDVSFEKRYSKPITLSEIKADKNFEGFDLVRNSRLSVMPVPPPYLEVLLNKYL
ncbi:MAG: EVE domain-containing protein [Chloroherpetonaceae bacterium]|nr:EVE domain-containing protein [Chloroherpetonaceae bacterium]